jgi:hypothetical protein
MSVPNHFTAENAEIAEKEMQMYCVLAFLRVLCVLRGEMVLVDVDELVGGE